MDKESKTLDYFDRKILFELDRNARVTATEIGKKIRKSKQFVDYRIQKLEERGVLKGYVAVIDYSKLGYQSMRVYFKFHNITPEQQQKLEEDLIKDKEVWWFVSIQGPWDVAYATAVKNILDFYTYWDALMQKYRKYIQDSLVVVYTHIHQYPKSYLVEKENTDQGTLVGASKELAKLNHLDIEILKTLSDNGRIPLLELSEKLKSSPQVVRSHIKRLEKEGVIQRYRATIDTSMFGYRYYKSYINLLHTNRLKELEEFCMKHPNILTVNRTIGYRDFEIEFQTKGFDEFDAIMNEIKSKFVGMIDDYVFIMAREEKKMVYFPFE